MSLTKMPCSEKAEDKKTQNSVTINFFSFTAVCIYSSLFHQWYLGGKDIFNKYEVASEAECLVALVPATLKSLKIIQLPLEFGGNERNVRVYHHFSGCSFSDEFCRFSLLKSVHIAKPIGFLALYFLPSKSQWCVAKSMCLGETHI